jgi:hypothetical protein
MLSKGARPAYEVIGLLLLISEVDGARFRKNSLVLHGQVDASQIPTSATIAYLQPWDSP